VEEITTTYESDSDISKHPPVRNRKGRKTARQRNNDLVGPASGPSSIQDDTLLGVEISHFDTRVPFPEGGVEIVSRSKVDASNEANEEDEDATGILISQISEWEQNWLFKRRKQILRRRNLMAESVSMLVPNPSDDGVEPQIGDDKISDLSDLSDHVNDNEDDDDDLDVSSSEQSETEEIVENEIILTKKDNMEAFAPKIQVDIKVSTTVEDAVVATQEKAKPKEEIPVQEELIEKSYAKKPIQKPIKKIEKKPKETVLIDQQPMNSETSLGKTAKFTCIANENSPDFSNYLNRQCQDSVAKHICTCFQFYFMIRCSMVPQRKLTDNERWENLDLLLWKDPSFPVHLQC
jgi:hypothetical protein